MTDEQLLAVYRHDAHKMRGRSHDAGSRSLAGVTVNQSVPYGADGDAAALSLPSGEPSGTVDGEETHYRLSLLTGSTRYDPDQFSLAAREDELKALLATTDAAEMHRVWLASDTVSAFNETVYQPYTSLKYHTLLVAALVDCYRNGADFGDLYLVADGPDEIVTHRTVYAGDEFTLRLSPHADCACANIPTRPFRSWASVWGRMTDHPIDTADNKFTMTLDSHLRRVRAWSTALQFIEDYQAWRPDT